MLKIQIGNDQITVDDLLKVRASYPITEAEAASNIKRYEQELKEVENRLFFFGRNEDLSPCAYVQLIMKNADNDPELANGYEIAHIHDLRVRSDQQRQGIGFSLMDALEFEAFELGIKVLTLGVDNWNTHAIHFYDQLGYRKFKEVSGRSEDEVCYYMQKQLLD